MRKVLLLLLFALGFAFAGCYTSRTVSLDNSDIVAGENGGSPDVSGLFIYARCPVKCEHCPVELHVTDPNGLRTGFDEATGETLQEIPDSSYSMEPGIADLDNPSDYPLPEEQQFEELLPTSGKYTLQIIGKGTGRYTIDIVAYDFNGKPSSQTIAGNSVPGVITIYQIGYSSAAGSKVSVSFVNSVANSSGTH